MKLHSVDNNNQALKDWQRHSDGDSVWRNISNLNYEFDKMKSDVQADVRNSSESAQRALRELTDAGKRIIRLESELSPEQLQGLSASLNRTTDAVALLQKGRENIIRAIDKLNQTVKTIFENNNITYRDLNSAVQVLQNGISDLKLTVSNSNDNLTNFMNDQNETNDLMAFYISTVQNNKADGCREAVIALQNEQKLSVNSENCTYTIAAKMSERIAFVVGQVQRLESIDVFDGDKWLKYEPQKLTLTTTNRLRIVSRRADNDNWSNVLVTYSTRRV